MVTRLASATPGPSRVQPSVAMATSSVAETCRVAGAVLNQPFDPFGVCEGVIAGGVESVSAS